MEYQISFNVSQIDMSQAFDPGTPNARYPFPAYPRGWARIGLTEELAVGEVSPIRYFGRFFYCDGQATVEVPAGRVRVEVWKGFEYRPETLTTEIAPGATRNVELTLTQPLHMPELGYWSGDPHIHIPRRTTGARPNARRSPGDRRTLPVRSVPS